MQKTIPALALLLLALAFTPAAEAKCFPVYGNWCGANYPPPGTNPPPADAFDNACRNHDLCYAATWGGAGCDANLLRELNVLRFQYGFLPRPLQWAESMLRMRFGGMPWTMPFPTPGDMFGVMDMMSADCGY